MSEVTQKDREAAAAFYGTWGGTKGWQHLEEPIRKGLVDDNALVRAFARHREQAEQATVAKIVAWLRDGARWLNGGECCGQKDSDGVCLAPACIWGQELGLMHDIADAIEAGEWK